MARIFVSYSRSDRRFVNQFIPLIRRVYGNDSVWFDDDIHGGTDWWQTILNEISKCKLFVYLISNESLESSYCQAELREAIRLRKRVLPIIVRRLSPEYPGKIKTDLAEFLKRIQYEDMSGGFGNEAVNATNIWGAMRELLESDRSPRNNFEVNLITSEPPVLDHTTKITSYDFGTSIDALLKSFDWIAMQDFECRISKYPVTNEQFAVFKKDGGYQNRRWWLQSGWREKEVRNWKAPRYWHDPKWNGNSYPVVGVSWYEAFAFSRWLSSKFGDNIQLPTEAQWQHAAQGYDNRNYPWGFEWNADRCNNSATNATWGQTTPVTQYENIGDSPFGVVDMLGNVWEWCLDLDGNKKPLRGGCWRSKSVHIERRTERRAFLSFNLWGFRLVRQAR